MSIQIDSTRCKSCGRCSGVCPGNLIEKDGDKRAFIKHPRECWGCTACLKECSVGAIRYYLGADIGGQGGYLYTENNKEYINWYIVTSDKKEHQIRVNKQDSNKY